MKFRHRPTSQFYFVRGKVYEVLKLRVLISMCVSLVFILLKFQRNKC